MRIGCQGSISPAGDLVAFGLTLAIVLSLSGLVHLMLQEASDEDPITPELLRALATWKGWDKDGDGTIEHRSLIDIEAGGPSPLFPDGGQIFVNITIYEVTHSFTFSEGIVSPGGNLESISHSVPILVLFNSTSVPASMRVSEGSI